MVVIEDKQDVMYHSHKSNLIPSLNGLRESTGLQFTIYCHAYRCNYCENDFDIKKCKRKVNTIYYKYHNTCTYSFQVNIVKMIAQRSRMQTG